jgi:hypothetical protein
MKWLLWIVGVLLGVVVLQQVSQRPRPVRSLS